jgi:hypothetical protein
VVLGEAVERLDRLALDRHDSVSVGEALAVDGSDGKRHGREQRDAAHTNLVVSTAAAISACIAGDGCTPSPCAQSSTDARSGRGRRRRDRHRRAGHGQ